MCSDIRILCKEEGCEKVLATRTQKCAFGLEVGVECKNKTDSKDGDTRGSQFCKEHEKKQEDDGDNYGYNNGFESGEDKSVEWRTRDYNRPADHKYKDQIKPFHPEDWTDGPPPIVRAGADHDGGDRDGDNRDGDNRDGDNAA